MARYKMRVSFHLSWYTFDIIVYYMHVIIMQHAACSMQDARCKMQESCACMTEENLRHASRVAAAYMYMPGPEPPPQKKL